MVWVKTGTAAIDGPLLLTTLVYEMVPPGETVERFADWVIVRSGGKTVTVLVAVSLPGVLSVVVDELTVTDPDITVPPRVAGSTATVRVNG